MIIVCAVLVHRMGEGEWSAYSRAGRGTYFKFWPIGKELFSKGTLKREGALVRGFTVVANFPFCFGILIFSVSNLILTCLET